MNNPLIAETQDSTEAYSGIPLLESVFDTKQAIESGDWAAGVMGVIGAGLDMLGAVMDPIGTILSSGVGWLLEHVGPLSDALDALTGDPDQIRAHSETWSNVAGELASISSDLLQAVEEDTTTWTGPAADTYRQRGADTATLIQAAQSAAEGASSGIATAGEVVAAVRTLVRDIIAEVVGRLVSWALQVVATLGIGLSWVVPQVTRTVAKVASQISDLVTKLVEAMSKLGPLLAKLGSKFQEATSKLKKIKSGDPGATRSVEGGNTTPSGFSGTNGDRGGSGGGAPKTDPPPRSEPTTDSTTTTSGSSTPPAGRPRSGDTTPSTTRGGRNDTVPAKDRNCVGDPVDVATGEVVVTQIDLTLPHLTHPAFERTHVSSYREGRWFGPSWSSTLDQRLELHDRTVRYFAPDGMILTYPVPSAPGSVFPKTGPQWPLSRHDDGDWTLEQRPAGRTLRFAGSGDVLPLRAVEGADGERSELAYDESGAPTVLTHSNGVRLGFRVEDSRVTELSVLGSGDVPDVVVMRYGYDDRRQLTAVVNSSGVPMRFDYDSQGRITGWQDRNGVWYRYVYDSAGRCVRTVGTDGFLDSVFTYDPERRVTTHTDSLGNTTVYELNEAHQTVRETDPLGNVTAFEWNHANQLIARTDPLGRVTRYAYGADGLPVSITRPDGSVVSLDHDADTLTSFTVVENDRAWTRHFTESAPDPVDEPIGVATALDLSAPPLSSPPRSPTIATSSAGLAHSRFLEGAASCSAGRSTEHAHCRSARIEAVRRGATTARATRSNTSTNSGASPDASTAPSTCSPPRSIPPEPAPSTATTRNCNWCRSRTLSAGSGATATTPRVGSQAKPTSTAASGASNTTRQANWSGPLDPMARSSTTGTTCWATSSRYARHTAPPATTTTPPEMSSG